MSKKGIREILVQAKRGHAAPACWLFSSSIPSLHHFHCFVPLLTPRRGAINTSTTTTQASITQIPDAAGLSISSRV